MLCDFQIVHLAANTPAEGRYAHARLGRVSCLPPIANPAVLRRHRSSARTAYAYPVKITFYYVSVYSSYIATHHQIKQLYLNNPLQICRLTYQ